MILGILRGARRVRRPPREPMTTVPHGEPIALSHRAADDLHFIRRTMESSGLFTSVPGSTGLLLGATALGASAFASRVDSDAAWLTVWLTAALLSALLGIVSIERRARALGTSLLARQGRRFLLGLLPALLVGAVLTFVLARGDMIRTLPGVWLMLYGAGVTTAGLLSLRLLLAMGAFFMLFGVAALAAPPAWGDVSMALGFGGLHIAFGLLLRRSAR